MALIARPIAIPKDTSRKRWSAVAHPLCESMLLELYCDPTKPLTRCSSYVKAARRVTALRGPVWSHKLANRQRTSKGEPLMFFKLAFLGAPVLATFLAFGATASTAGEVPTP